MREGPDGPPDCASDLSQRQPALVELVSVGSRTAAYSAAGARSGRASPRPQLQAP